MLTSRNETENVEERPSQQNQTQRALSEIREPLFHDRNRNLDRLSCSHISRIQRIVCHGGRVHGCNRLTPRRRLVLLVLLLGATHDEEGGGVDGRLGDEPVRRRYAEQACNEGRDSQEKEVVVEPGRLAQGELGALGDERLFHIRSQMRKGDEERARAE